MNLSTKIAANAIIKHYKKQGVSLNQACKYAVIDLDFVCNFKTLYHISRGQNTSPRVEHELRKLHHTIAVVNLLPTDTSHGVIRIDFDNGIDGHEARALILAQLTPKQRGAILFERAKEKL